MMFAKEPKPPACLGATLKRLAKIATLPELQYMRELNESMARRYADRMYGPPLGFQSPVIVRMDGVIRLIRQTPKHHE